MRCWPYLMLFVLLFFSCKNESSKASISNTLPKEEKTEVLPPAPPVTTPQKPIDGEWAAFWTRFQKATKSKSRPLQMTMINFPLKWEDTIIPEENYSKYHRRIFEVPIVQKVVSTQASEITAEKLYGEAYENSYVKTLGLRPGVKVYKMKYSNFQITDGGLKEMATEYYYFPYFEEKGYLLAWIEEVVH